MPVPLGNLSAAYSFTQWFGPTCIRASPIRWLRFIASNVHINDSLSGPIQKVPNGILQARFMGTKHSVSTERRLSMNRIQERGVHAAST